MEDQGHKWTEERLKELETRIRSVYQESVSDAEAKMASFTARFAAKNKSLLEQLEAKKITQEDYQDWLAGQVFQRERWQAMLEDLTNTLAQANEIAAQIINEETPEAFAYNANWASYLLEKQLDAAGFDIKRVMRPGGKTVSPEDAATNDTRGVVQFGFGLYDANTVKRLLRDDPDLLPPSRVDIPQDKKWNHSNITRQILQGILQGEDLDTIAKRLRNVEDMNLNASLTHARTAMTGAQNAGRMDSYSRAEALGLDVWKEWVAALDGHTRATHRLLDGQRRKKDEDFVVQHNGRTHRIRYPGDPTAAAAMVYNCRCTLVAWLPEYPSENEMRRDDDPDRVPIRDMTYIEWLEYKKAQQNNDRSTGRS